MEFILDPNIAYLVLVVAILLAVLPAGGDRPGQLLWAEGFATAQTLGQRSLTLQYFDTLRNLETGAVKIISPLKFIGLIANFAHRPDGQG